MDKQKANGSAVVTEAGCEELISRKEKPAQVVVVEPPDGGWGWVIVFGSFMVHVFCDGFMYTMGVFVKEFCTEFGVGKGESGGVAGVLAALTFGSGPLAAAFTNRWGCRIASVAGSLICLLGMILTSIAPSMAFVYAACAILTGFGLGMIYLPAIVVVGYYFERYRALATGLAVCGSGVGTFVFAPIIRLLIDSYGWRGAMLVLGAIVFNSMACGALFRPLYPSLAKTGSNGVQKLPTNNAHDGCHSSVAAECDQANEQPERKTLGDDHLTSSYCERVTRSLNVLDVDCSGAHAKGVPITGRYRKHVRGKTRTRALTERFIQSDAHDQPRRRLNKTQVVLQRSDIFYPSSLANIPQFVSNPNIYSAIQRSVTHLDSDIAHRSLKQLKTSSHVRGSAIEDGSSGSGSGSDSDSDDCGLGRRFRSTFSAMVDWRIVANPLFLTFLLSNFFTSVGFNGPWIYLEDRAKEECHIDASKAVFLLSAIGVGNTLGRIVFGWLGSYADRLFVYSVPLVLAGAACCLSVLLTSYWPLMVYGAVYGFFIGAYVALTSVLIVDLLGIEHLTNAFGLTLLVQGAATVIGPIILGKMNDWSGNYGLTFILMGGFLVVSGLMLWPLKLTESYRQRRSLILGHSVDHQA